MLSAKIATATTSPINSIRLLAEIFSQMAREMCHDYATDSTGLSLSFGSGTA